MTTNPIQLTSIDEPLTFTAEGAWLHGTEFVTHPKIAAFLSKQLRYYPEIPGFGVESINRIVPVTVEDTCRVVISIEPVDNHLLLRLNDGQEEVVAELWVTTAGIFYCETEAFGPARVTRSAQQSIYHLISEINGAYSIALNSNTKIPIHNRK